MKTNFRVLHFCFIAVIAMLFFFNAGCAGNETSVGFSENRDELILTAEFPRKKSGIVYDFLKSKFGLQDLTGLGRLEIKQYQTPDRRMNFYIKTRLQHFEIRMERQRNSQEAYKTLKRATEQLKELLTS